LCQEESVLCTIHLKPAVSGAGLPFSLITPIKPLSSSRWRLFFES
jgi:hypothetical protein